MATQLYPKVPKDKETKSDRPWRVEYKYMAFDAGSSSSWDQYYRTEFGARWSAWWWEHVRSWGGNVTLYDQVEERAIKAKKWAEEHPPKAPGGASGGSWRKKR